jgi:hypothetical protein
MVMMTIMDRTAKIAMCIVFAAGLMLPAPGNVREVYKWTDKTGVVHYSDALPTNGVSDF